MPDKYAGELHISALENKIKDIDDEIYHLNSTKDEMQSDIDELLSKVRELEASSEENADDINEIKSRLEM